MSCTWQCRSGTHWQICLCVCALLLGGKAPKEPTYPVIGLNFAGHAMDVKARQLGHAVRKILRSVEWRTQAAMSTGRGCQAVWQALSTSTSGLVRIHTVALPVVEDGLTCSGMQEAEELKNREQKTSLPAPSRLHQMFLYLRGDPCNSFR